jgi:DNA-binding transcriptional ArsR family regulator
LRSLVRDAGPVFVALSDATRRSIVEQLGAQPATASDLAGVVPVTRQAVVKHLGVLEDAGLVRGTRDGRRVVYELTPEPFGDAAEWMSSVGAAWDRRLAALSRRVESRRRGGRPPASS